MSGNGSLPPRAQALIDFWFGAPGDPLRETHRDIWFRSTPQHDALLRRLFLADHEQAACGALASWEGSCESVLALLLLLDQIPRNVFRGTPRAGWEAFCDRWGLAALKARPHRWVEG